VVSKPNDRARPKIDSAARRNEVKCFMAKMLVLPGKHAEVRKVTKKGAALLAAPKVSSVILSEAKNPERASTPEIASQIQLDSSLRSE